jgi:hypothetical protein
MHDARAADRQLDDAFLRFTFLPEYAFNGGGAD